MKQPLLRLPIGIQEFEKLRTGGYVYVDKTEQIYDLINRGSYYFLSRPRRFGKSLLMSTIKAFYEGKRELFTGLAIAQKDVDWVAHPVLHLDLNTNQYNELDVLKKKLQDSLSQWEQEYDCKPNDLPLGMRFEKVIEQACHKS